MDNVLGLMGLAKKAGKIKIGNDMSKEAVYDQKTRLVLIAKDASERIIKDFELFKHKSFKNYLKELLPSSLIEYFIKYLKI